MGHFAHAALCLFVLTLVPYITESQSYFGGRFGGIYKASDFFDKDDNSTSGKLPSKPERLLIGLKARPGFPEVKGLRKNKWRGPAFKPFPETTSTSTTATTTTTQTPTTEKEEEIPISTTPQNIELSTTVITSEVLNNEDITTPIPEVRAVEFTQGSNSNSTQVTTTAREPVTEPLAVKETVIPLCDNDTMVTLFPESTTFSPNADMPSSPEPAVENESDAPSKPDDKLHEPKNVKDHFLETSHTPASEGSASEESTSYKPNKSYEDSSTTKRLKEEDLVFLVTTLRNIISGLKNNQNEAEISHGIEYSTNIPNSVDNNQIINDKQLGETSSIFENEEAVTFIPTLNQHTTVSPGETQSSQSDIESSTVKEGNGEYTPEPTTLYPSDISSTTSDSVVSSIKHDDDKLNANQHNKSNESASDNIAPVIPPTVDFHKYNGTENVPSMNNETIGPESSPSNKILTTTNDISSTNETVIKANDIESRTSKSDLILDNEVPATVLPSVNQDILTKHAEESPRTSDPTVSVPVSSAPAVSTKPEENKTPITHVTDLPSFVGQIFNVLKETYPNENNLNVSSVDPSNNLEVMPSATEFPRTNSSLILENEGNMSNSTPASNTLINLVNGAIFSNITGKSSEATTEAAANIPESSEEITYTPASNVDLMNQTSAGTSSMPDHQPVTEVSSKYESTSVDSHQIATETSYKYETSIVPSHQPATTTSPNNGTLPVQHEESNAPSHQVATESGNKLATSSLPSHQPENVSAGYGTVPGQDETPINSPRNGTLPSQHEVSSAPNHQVTTETSSTHGTSTEPSHQPASETVHMGFKEESNHTTGIVRHEQTTQGIKSTEHEEFTQGPFQSNEDEQFTQGPFQPNEDEQFTQGPFQSHDDEQFHQGPFQSDTDEQFTQGPFQSDDEQFTQGPLQGIGIEQATQHLLNILEDLKNPSLPPVLEQLVKADAKGDTEKQLLNKEKQNAGPIINTTQSVDSTEMPNPMMLSQDDNLKEVSETISKQHIAGAESSPDLTIVEKGSANKTDDFTTSKGSDNSTSHFNSTTEKIVTQIPEVWNSTNKSEESNVQKVEETPVEESILKKTGNVFSSYWQKAKDYVTKVFT